MQLAPRNNDYISAVPQVIVTKWLWVPQRQIHVIDKVGGISVGGIAVLKHGKSNSSYPSKPNSRTLDGYTLRQIWSAILYPTLEIQENIAYFVKTGQHFFYIFCVHLMHI